MWNNELMKLKISNKFLEKKAKFNILTAEIEFYFIYLFKILYCYLCT